MKHIAQHEIVGITKAEFDALVWVRDELANGRIERNNFDMGAWRDHEEEAECGAVCCIGGWMSYKLDYKIYDNKDRILFESHRFRSLFFPMRFIAWKKLAITPSQAVRAIDNFLFNSPGNPQWAEAVKA